MRKQFKALLCVVFVIAMMTAMAVSAFAADSGKLVIPAGDGTTSTGDGEVKVDGGTIKWSGLVDGKGIESKTDDADGTTVRYQINIAPKDTTSEALKAGHVDFIFTVDKAGEYTITLGYASKTNAGTTRVADLLVDGKRTSFTIDQNSTTWNQRLETKLEKIPLKAGENTVTIIVPENFDNETLKGVNVIDLAWSLEKETPSDDAANPAETQAPSETQTPAETEAPAQSGNSGSTDKAPQTGFATVAIAIAAIGSGAYVVSRKKH